MYYMKETPDDVVCPITVYVPQRGGGSGDFGLHGNGVLTIHSLVWCEKHVENVSRLGLRFFSIGAKCLHEW